MKKKGFTLIELLAVIVIISVVAMIAVPIILNVINNSKKEAIKQSAVGYVDAIEKTILKNKTENDNTNYDGDYTINKTKIIKNSETASLLPILDLVELNVNVKGEVPKTGNVTIKNLEVKTGKFYYDNYLVTLNNGKYSVQILTNSNDNTDISSLEARIEKLENEVQTLKSKNITYDVLFEGTADTVSSEPNYSLTSSYKNYKYLIVYSDSTKHKNVSSWTSSGNNSLIIDTATIVGESKNYVIAQYYDSSWYYFINFTFSTETKFRVIEKYSNGWIQPRIYKIVGIK